VRKGATYALVWMGMDGRKARNLLLKCLAEEKDRDVIGAILLPLRNYYGGNPEMDKARKDAQARLQLPEPPPPPDM